MPDLPSVTNMFDLTGEVALVTGASSGLGRRIAKVLSGQGAKVVLCDRITDKLETLKAEIEFAKGDAACVAMDVSNSDGIASAFDAAEAAFGTVTILINHAGIAKPAKAIDMSRDDWRAVLGVNLDAVWFVAQEAARRMAAAGCAP